MVGLVRQLLRAHFDVIMKISKCDLSTVTLVEGSAVAKVMANQCDEVVIVPEMGESSFVPDPCSLGDVRVRTSSVKKAFLSFSRFDDKKKVLPSF